MQHPTASIESDESKRDALRRCNRETFALLESWEYEDEDIEEQRESLEELMRALDRDRMSSRKLFP